MARDDGNPVAVMDLNAMRRALLKSTPEAVFRGDCLRVVALTINGYQEEMTEYILQAGAASWLLQKYITDASELDANPTFDMPDLLQKSRIILRRFLKDCSQIDDASEETDLLELMKRIKAPLDWYDGDGRLCVPPRFLIEGQNVYEAWQNYNAFGFASLNEFMLSDHDVLRLQLTESAFDRAVDTDKMSIMSACATRLMHKVGDLQVQYGILKKYRDQFSPDLDVTRNLAQEFAQAIYYLLSTSDKKSIQACFDRLAQGSRECLALALNYVCHFETPDTVAHYPDLCDLNKFIDADCKLDPVPLLFKEKLEATQYRSQIYCDPFFDAYLTQAYFQKSAIVGKSCIIKAVLFRLTHMRFGGRLFSESLCEGYCQLLRQSSFCSAPSVLETLSWFDKGVLVDYPTQWIEMTSIDVIWQRVIDLEFNGDKIAFFESDHALLRRFTQDADGHLLFESEQESALVLGAKAHIAYLRLKDRAYRGRDRQQPADFLESHYEEPPHYETLLLVLDAYHEPDLLGEELFAQRGNQALHRFYALNDNITQALTYLRYRQASFYTSRLLAHIALARLQHIIYVNSEAYNLHNRHDYLKIVYEARLDLLKDDMIFCHTAETLLVHFQFNQGIYDQGAFDARYQQLIEFAFYSDRQISELNTIPDAIIDVTRLTLELFLQASPKMRSIIDTIGLPIILDQLEKYIKEHEQKLMAHKGKCLPVTHSVLAQAAAYRELLEHHYTRLDQEHPDSQRCCRILKKLCADGSYDDRFIMYENAIEKRFKGKTFDYCVFQPDDDTKANCLWFFNGPSLITKLLTVSNYNAGSFITRLVFIKAAICLFEAGCFKADPGDLALIIKSGRSDFWYTAFGSDVQRRLKAVYNDPEMMGAEYVREETSRRVWFFDQAPPSNPDVEEADHRPSVAM